MRSLTKLLAVAAVSAAALSYPGGAIPIAPDPKAQDLAVAASCLGPEFRLYRSKASDSKPLDFLVIGEEHKAYQDKLIGEYLAGLNPQIGIGVEFSSHEAIATRDSEFSRTDYLDFLHPGTLLFPLDTDEAALRQSQQAVGRFLLAKLILFPALEECKDDKERQKLRSAMVNVGVDPDDLEGYLAAQSRKISELVPKRDEAIIRNVLEIYAKRIPSVIVLGCKHVDRDLDGDGQNDALLNALEGAGASYAAFMARRCFNR